MDQMSAKTSVGLRELVAKARAEGRGELELSPLEVKVFDESMLGGSCAEIAFHLGVKRGTVANCLSRIYIKKGVKTRAELMALVGREMLPKCKRSKRIVDIMRNGLSDEGPLPAGAALNG
jgi:DNA-binding CsgD family transcriptional regulator